jgi:hypothetical protein
MNELKKKRNNCCSRVVGCWMLIGKNVERQVPQNTAEEELECAPHWLVVG